MSYDPHTTAGSCNQCSHYGGWVPTIVGGRRQWIYGWCLRHRQMATQPLLGCAHFNQVEPARTAPIVWSTAVGQPPAPGAAAA